MRTAKKNWALKFSTFIVVTACFFITSAASLVSQNFKSILTLWGEDVQLTVYLTPELSEKGREGISAKLLESGLVNNIQFVSQEKALAEFRAQLASYAPDMARDQELLRLIPESLQVRLKSEITAEERSRALLSLANEVKGLEGVEEVSYGQDWIEKYSAIVSAIETVLRSLNFIILIAALFVISNAIRASIENRREEIVVLEMIGATFAMIRRPFIIEGATLGLVAAAASLGLSWFSFRAFRNLVISKLSFLQLGEQLQFLSVPSILFFLFGGVFLGALASYLCVRRMNDGYAAIQG